jgi:hypothetical protein
MDRLGGELKSKFTCVSSVFFMFSIAATPSPAVARGMELKKATLNAFERHVQERQARQSDRLAVGRRFLWIDEAPDRARRVRQGEILVDPMGAGELKVPDGLIHDWIGAVFIPGATLETTLSLLHDYNNHKYIFRPDVLESKLLSRNGNEYQTFVRVSKKNFLSLVLDANYDVRFFPLDARRWRSETRSTRIREVENVGTPQERELPEGTGRGLVWRLNSWTRFEERDGGVYVECEVTSLSRGYPFGLAWAIRPMVREVPGKGITETLTSMRNAVLEVEQAKLNRPLLRAD